MSASGENEHYSRSFSSPVTDVELRKDKMYVEDGSGSYRTQFSSPASNESIPTQIINQGQHPILGDCGEFDEVDGFSNLSSLYNRAKNSPQDELGSDQKSKLGPLEVNQFKIQKIEALIEQAKADSQKNVETYLRETKNGDLDDHQRQKMKISFEKQNQKLLHTINDLQKKLSETEKRQQALDSPVISQSRSNRLKDVGQGLKGVVYNFKGAKEMVSKPLKFANIIKNKFGSADNIISQKIENSDQQFDLTHSDKSGGDDSESVVSAADGAKSQDVSCDTSQNFLEELLKDRTVKQSLEESLSRLEEDLKSFKSDFRRQIQEVKNGLDDDRHRFNNLDIQLVDLAELHQREIFDLKQEIAGSTDRLEYHLDERMNDIHDTLETSNTRIGKVELQQQHQKIISLEGVENFTFRPLLSKLANILLSLFICLSTFAKLMLPLFTPRSHGVATVVTLVSSVLVWYFWDIIIGKWQYWSSQISLFRG